MKKSNTVSASVRWSYALVSCVFLAPAAHATGGNRDETAPESSIDAKLGAFHRRGHDSRKLSQPSFFPLVRRPGTPGQRCRGWGRALVTGVATRIPVPVSGAVIVAGRVTRGHIGIAPSEPAVITSAVPAAVVSATLIAAAITPVAVAASATIPLAPAAVSAAMATGGTSCRVTMSAATTRMSAAAAASLREQGGRAGRQEQAHQQRRKCRLHQV